MYAPSFDTQNQENAFALVCDFALACVRANYKLNIMEQNTDENNIMAYIYMFFTEAPFGYTAVNWSAFDEQLEAELSSKR